MDVHRALAACPYCNNTAEVWYYKSKIAPTSAIECSRCYSIYDASEFIVALLDLYKNTTVSTSSLVNFRLA